MPERLRFLSITRVQQQNAGRYFGPHEAVIMAATEKGTTRQIGPLTDEDLLRIIKRAAELLGAG